MNLRTRIVAILGIVLIAVTGLLLFAGGRVVASGFGALERDQARHRASLAARQLDDEAVRVSELALDYAAWDDMHAYVGRPTTAFIESALPPNWLPRVRLQLVTVIDLEGNVVFGRSLMNDVSSTALPHGFAEHVGPGRPLVTHRAPESSRSGVLVLPDGPWVVASRPIITSAGDGPIRGTVLLGRRLDAALLERFSEAIALPIQEDSLSAAGIPVGGGYSVRFDSPEMMTALVPVNDIYGRPASVLGVGVPRQIEARHRGTEYYLAWSLLVAAVVFIGLVVALLNHYIVKRMAVLADFLRRVNASGDLASRLAQAGGDEIGQVATAVNDLLGTIEARNRDLEDARAQALGAMREAERKNKALEEANLTIERLARTDALTGLANRRMFDESLERQISRADRKHEPFSLIMMDMDHFKSINDENSHLIGDRVLVHTAAMMATKLRAYDIAARYGGEEFVLLLPATDLREAVAAAERIRCEVEELQVPGHPRRVTASFGVAQRMHGERAEAVLERADRALFHAKRAGRNRVEVDLTMTDFRTIRKRA